MRYSYFTSTTGPGMKVQHHHYLVVGVPARTVVVLLAILVVLITVFLPGKDVDNLLEKLANELLCGFLERINLARVTLVVVHTELLAVDLEGILVTLLGIDGSVLARPPSMPVVLVHKDRLPSALFVIVLLVIKVFVVVFLVVIPVPGLNTGLAGVDGAAEGGSHEGSERNESSNRETHSG
ncbi:uncharacterized protein EV420DRAFT_1568046 [Desarmillaria tabescens]|uniref:Uncharacterized protein n=1 Tax=Armillaria tabescens TaxID=1929756 RepID=A0AA39MVM4_ARMTA|nr:uncharacterized protein EV420DRAFT_1568046 [Desarmillaria tabescens]KAK0447873.1 hypothetical protein EV420DRAFT_1568046 [Desarmillaria tabescens]